MFYRNQLRWCFALVAFLVATVTSAQTHYVDFSTGSDANAGTKASPWKSSPYMNTVCSDNGGTHVGYTHVAGQQVIFKGGVTWPFNCFAMQITAGGTATAQDYYGVDLTWFVGASFTRPKFDLSGHVIGTPGGFQVMYIAPGGPQYVTIDNIEILNQGIGNLSSTGTRSYRNQCAIGFGSQGPFQSDYDTGTIVENVYIHAAVAPIFTGSTLSNGSYANLGYCAGGIDGVETVQNTEINGEDASNGGTTPTTSNWYFFMGGVLESRVVQFNKVHGTVNGCDMLPHRSSPAYSCHDNELFHVSNAGQTNATIVGQLHSHVIFDDQTNSDFSSGSYYNNYVHNNNAGLNVRVNSIAQVYNNVIVDNINNVPLYLQCYLRFSTNAPCPTTDTLNIFNNTMSPGNCLTNASGGTLGTVNAYNNICIGGSSLGSLTAAQYNNSPNRAPMTISEATMFGFISANKYAPTSLDSSVVNAGANLTSSCPTLTALCSDTEGAPWYGGSYVARANSAFTMGAYTWPLGGGGTPGFISLSPSSINFGGVTIGQSSSVQTSTLTNTGGTTVTFNSSTINGDFAFGGTGTCNGSGGTLAPSATCTMSAKFTPTATGARTGAITINDTASNSPQSIALSGTGVASLVTFTPSSNNFGSVNQGASSAAATFTLTNTSGATITLISVTNAGGNPGDFPITNTACTGVITAGNACTFTVTFTPTASGARSTTLTVAYSGGDNIGSKTSALSGTGIQVAVTPPTIFPPFGSFATLTQVTLSDSTAGATVCYTLDGSTPLTNGAGACVPPTLTYSAPIQLVGNAQIMAVGTKAALTDSGVSVAFITVMIPAGTGMFTELRR